MKTLCGTNLTEGVEQAKIAQEYAYIRLKTLLDTQGFLQAYTQMQSST